MADLQLILLFLASLSSSTLAQLKGSNITLGSSLSAGTNSNSSWLSPSGRFAFGFYQDGNGFRVGIWFAGIPEKTVVWTAFRDDPPVSGGSTLQLTRDGRLLVRTVDGRETIISDGSGSASSASMFDSGNFVLYSSGSQITIWESFNHPTDTILAGQKLSAGNQLFSCVNETDHSTGRFMLAMQTDGNLVLCPKDSANNPGDAYWSSQTSGSGSTVTLNLDLYGRLYLVNSTGFVVKNLTEGGFSGNGDFVYRSTLDVDGIFRLYQHRYLKNGSSTFSDVWSEINDPCAVNGFCGFNGYCTLMDTKPLCLCPLGFDYVDPQQHFQGCARSFPNQDCSRKNADSTFSVLVNTAWEDKEYAVLSPVTEQGCRQACLEDCYCAVALFKNGRCSKQKLPLRYGRRNPDEPTKALIKTGVSLNNSTLSTERKQNKQGRLILIVGIVLAGCSLTIFAISGFLIYRNRIWGYSKISEQRSFAMAEHIILRSFTYSELEKATQGFKEEIGRGAFGTVFKGYLQDAQRAIAVKKLDRVAGEAEREFRTEMRTIGRTHHRNLVRLLGFCDEGSNRILVYEFMSCGSLSSFLFKQPHPDWMERVRIAVEIARGILYLHEECETQIIHCDIKPQNILMDEMWVPKISDFGLAKLLQPDQTRTFTRIRGTRGYVAPEWHMNMPVTVKADVYSFGIMLLEIICCRKSVDRAAPEDQIVLCEWIFDCFKAGELEKLMDDEEVEKKRLERMVKVGLWCIQDDPSMRPSMKKVILMLEGTVDIPVPPSPDSFLSSMS